MCVTIYFSDDKCQEILEKEKQSREQAVEILMEAILALKEDGLSYFISALERANGMCDIKHGDVLMNREIYLKFSSFIQSMAGLLFLLL